MLPAPSLTAVFRGPLLSAPHRTFFAAGMLQLLLVLAVWTAEIFSRLAGGGGIFPDVLPARWGHMLLMLFGFFPFLFFGFLMTAMPRWLAASPLRGPQFQQPALFMAAGWLLAWGGLLLARAWPAAVQGVLVPGLLLVAFGIGRGTLVLGRLAATPLVDRRHAPWAVAAQALGVVALVSFAVGLARGDGDWVAVATLLGLWGYLFPVFLIVIHRMLPVFSTVVLGPRSSDPPLWTLWALLTGCLGHGILAAAGRPDWTWVVDLPLAGLGVWLGLRMGLRESRHNRLVATHHLAFVWFAAAMALFGVQSALLAGGVTWGGLAPLHALTLGFCLSMVLGMVTRVTLGHSGQRPDATPLVWAGFWGLQGAVLMRVLADLAMPAWAPALLLVSVLAALLVFALWASSFFRFLAR